MGKKSEVDGIAHAFGDGRLSRRDAVKKLLVAGVLAPEAYTALGLMTAADVGIAQPLLTDRSKARAIKTPAGAKLFGVNIAPTPTEAQAGDAVWAKLHVDWPWDTWIKRQIDAAIGNGLGCNCIRMIGDFLGVFTGLFSQETYNKHWVQLVSYCADRGVYVIVTGGFYNQVSGMSNRDISSNVISLLAALAAFDNVSYVDVMQEQDSWRVENAAARTNEICAAVRATTSLPLTFSSIHKINENDFTGWFTAIRKSCDILDFHIYKGLGYDAWLPVQPAYLDRWQAAFPDKQLIFGEVGSPQSDGVEQNRAFLANVFKLAATDRRLQGCCLWAAQDYGTTPDLQYGLFDAQWNMRSAQRAALQQMTAAGAVKPN